MEKRPSRSYCLMETAKIWAERGTCLRAKVGCLIEKGGRIISIGYVGAPSGQPHCLEAGCCIEDNGCIRGIHAEANAIGFAARNGISTEGAVLYTTVSPCVKCSQLIVASGIKKVVYLEEYRILKGMEYLIENGIRVERYGGDKSE